MEALHWPPALWLLGSIQVFGLGTVLFTRLSERSPLQAWCHRLFFASLIAVGLVTVASLALGPGATLLSGSTLAVMSVAAVCELRPAANIETF
jgi:hypothetical protein